MCAVSLPRDDVSVSISARTGALVRPGQSEHAVVRDVGAFDQPDSLELWQRGELRDRLVGQVETEAEIDVPNSVARLYQSLHCVVRDV